MRSTSETPSPLRNTVVRPCKPCFCSLLDPRPVPPHIYMEEGYSITRTEAPKERGGRLCLNCARTTPELPGRRDILSGTKRLQKHGRLNVDDFRGSRAYHGHL